jgi:hypothetical protein
VLVRELSVMRDDQLATKGDIGAFRHDVDARFTSLRHDMETGFASLRHGMDVGFARARAERESLRADLHERMNELQAQQSSQFRQLLYANLGTTLTVAAIAFGAASLG